MVRRYMHAWAELLDVRKVWYTSLLHKQASSSYTKQFVEMLFLEKLLKSKQIGPNWKWLYRYLLGYFFSVVMKRLKKMLL